MKNKIRRLINEVRFTENQKEIIKAVGVGVLVASAMVCPGMAILLKDLKPKDAKETYRIKQSVEKLRKRGVLELSGDEIKLTKRGQKLFKMMEIEDVGINIPESWDGQWHLVCYDVPEKYKTERDYFRQRLIRLDFAQIQDSLWAYPFECKEENAIIADYYGIDEYVAYLTTDHLPGQKELMNRFALT